MRTALSLIFVLGLTACGYTSNPGAIPTGYKYHGTEFNARPGPEAASIGYEYSAEHNAEILQHWRLVVSDLLDDLESDANLSPQDVSVNTAISSSAFYNSFDHVLREDLSERGYTLVNDSAALMLHYDAQVPKRDKTAPEEKLEPAMQDYLLQLTATRGASIVGQASGIYELPSYGYHKLPVFELPKSEPALEKRSTPDPIAEINEDEGAIEKIEPPAAPAVIEQKPKSSVTIDLMEPAAQQPSITSEPLDGAPPPEFALPLPTSMREK